VLKNPRSASACWQDPTSQIPSICPPVMVIWSCSSCLRGSISRSMWRRHYPLLSPRSPALPPIHFFSSSPRRSTKRSAAKAPMDSAREPFYVVRKGGVIGIYKTLNDCQAQVGNSVRVHKHTTTLCFPYLTMHRDYICWWFPATRYVTLLSLSTKAILCVKKLRIILLHMG